MFQKGQSGNPGGRPKNPFGELIRKQTKDGKELVDRALQIMRKSKDDDIVLKAMVFLRDTGFGKPAQALEVSAPGGGPMQVKVEVVNYAGAKHPAPL